MDILKIDNDQLGRWAETRETSIEIAEAIHAIAANQIEANRIWDDPSPEERVLIWEHVTNNGQRSARKYCWGEDGHDWVDRLNEV